MTPLQVPKNFKFKLFLVNEIWSQIPCYMLDLMLTKLLIAHLSLDFYNNFNSRKDGKEHVEPSKLFKNKPKRSHEKSCVF